jgi:phosphate-selective porin OprO/OprP
MRSLSLVLLLASGTAVAEDHAGTASYDDGDGQGRGFVIQTEDAQFSLRFGGRVQPFFNTTITPDETTSNFEIRRGRLQLDGNLWGKDGSYRFQADWGKGNATIKDFFGEVALGHHTWLRFGQFKKPFSRQQITAFFRTEISDRAITDRAFGAGRDIGVSLHNGYENSPTWEWTIGVFNGTGDVSKLEGVTAVVDDTTGEVTVDSSKAKLGNVPREFQPIVVARIGHNGHNHGKLRGYSEADLEGGPLRWGVGLSIQAEGDLDRDNKSNQKVELDYIVKVNGLSTTGGLYAQTAQDGNSVYDQGKSLVGFHVQAGYMVAKHWQLGGRYAAVGDTAVGGTQATDQQELAITANFYKHQHDAKFVWAVRLFKNGDAKFTDVVLVEVGANLGW